ncbi:hypothetical protein CC80DRAFT_493888 [Byssothecium circinans]|uniref:Extracellular membrane protein CFEM domain-containing protein n=1 Tax=Byssothecium circinans TaxID=147558 RepID=A0A6A5TP19_9PLEO|nr:hypothetical protein CC80DRAFT_493888 [Byssothecium circinans]
MKSSFVLASLLSLAAASPIVARDDCACPSVMCLQAFPESCECEADALAKCAKTLPSHCDRSILEASEPCAAVSKKTPNNNHDSTIPGLGASCGSRGQKPCLEGLYCDMSGVNPKIADAPGKCAVKKPKTTGGAISTSSCTTSTGKPSHTGGPKTLTFVPTGVSTGRPTTTPIGQMCGSWNTKPCPTGYKCSFADVPPFVADMPGKCVPASAVTGKTTASGYPTNTERPSTTLKTHTPTGSISTSKPSNVPTSTRATSKNPSTYPKPTSSSVVSKPTPTPSGAVCGGLLGVDCAEGLKCVLDQKCVESHTSDCQGVCLAAGGDSTY